MTSADMVEEKGGVENCKKKKDTNVSVSMLRYTTKGTILAAKLQRVERSMPVRIKNAS